MLAAGSALSGTAPASLLPPYMKPLPASAPTTAAPAPAAAPPPSQSSSVPDLSYLVSRDPVYTQAQADEKAALAAAAAQRDASINQSLIGFGAIPDLGSLGRSLGLTPDQIGMITGSINPETGALANQYTGTGNSVLGQLNHAHDQALKQLRANLAAHGTLESGATGVGVGQSNDSYQQGLSSAYQQLLSALLGYEGNYANSGQSALTSLQNAASDAYNRAVQMAENGLGGQATTTPATIPRQIDYQNGQTAAGMDPSSVGFLTRAGIGAGGATNSDDPAAVPKPPKPYVLPNYYETGRKRFG